LHPINELLSRFGFRLLLTVRLMHPPDYRHNLRQLKKSDRGFSIYRSPASDMGPHPENHYDYEAGFAADHISRIRPKEILDVGSDRRFINGLLAGYLVTTVDVRERRPNSKRESVLTCDAKKLNCSDASFDVVLSLCALHHFGLGRYGDEFDPDADRKAFGEMIRVLRAGGYLIFSTTVTRAQASIAFNAHRIYTHDMIKRLCLNLVCVEERFYSQNAGNFCSPEQVTDEPGLWDVYCGCWRKPS